MMFNRGDGKCKAHGKSPTSLECVQQPGEIIWVPNYWCVVS